MSKFNTRQVRTVKPSASRAASSVVRTKKKSTTTTALGAPGWKRKPKSELFVLGVSNLVGEDTFHESAGERDLRFVELVRKFATEDFEWLAGFLTWLRIDSNLRTAPIVGAVEAIRTRMNAKAYGPENQKLIDAVLRRADEPGEMIAYYRAVYGRTLPMPIKKGIGAAVRRMYNERNLLKWDTDSRAYRFGDVLELVHPSADEGKPWQRDLFEYAITRRHQRDEKPPKSLKMVRNREKLFAMPQEKRRSAIDADTFAEAGMTWEAVGAWLNGAWTAEAWEAVIPSMGYMALLRNLRNFDQTGVSDAVAKEIADRLANPDEVAQSRQLPIRFLSAYRETQSSLRWGWAIEQALELSLSNVPELAGNSLILVDRSGSMMDPLSRNSSVNRADAAALFGTVLARRAEKMDLIEYGSSSRPVPFRKGESLLKVIGKFTWMGGTYTAEAVKQWFNGHDRVIIVTDEQAATWAQHRGGWASPWAVDPGGMIPQDVPMYTWNLAGYKTAHAASGSENRHTFGGLSDAAFSMVPLIEAGQNADWPWLAPTVD